jgi:hypothetical protein
MTTCPKLPSTWSAASTKPSKRARNWLLSPMVSTLRAGEVAIYKSQGSAPETIALDGGVAEVNENGLTILAEKLG